MSKEQWLKKNGIRIEYHDKKSRSFNIGWAAIHQDYVTTGHAAENNAITSMVKFLEIESWKK